MHLQQDHQDKTKFNLMEGTNIKFCPLIPPIAVPGQLSGQVSFVQFPCNTNCALLQVIRNENDSTTNKTVITQHCTPNDFTTQLEIKTNSNQLNILK